MKKFLEKHLLENKYIGAICAAPTVLKHFNLFKPTENAKQRATYHDSVDGYLNDCKYSRLNSIFFIISIKISDVKLDNLVNMCFNTFNRVIFLDFDRPINDPVVLDGKLITSKGPGTAFDFAINIVRLFDSTVAEKIVPPMLFTGENKIFYVNM